MAPLEESEYFPALDSCFAGDVQLISWRIASLRLGEREEPVKDGPFSKFFTHKDTIALLTRATDPFSPPSAGSKSAFNTKTAAINVTPSTHGDYDIEAIKKDSLWLSDQVNIDEISALRIVVLEWQNRPSFRLLDEFSEAEKTSLRAAAGFDKFASSIGAGNVPELLLALDSRTTSSRAFDSQENTRRRLLVLYLSERRFLLKASHQLVAAALSWSTTKKSDVPQAWTEKLGIPINEGQLRTAASNEHALIGKLVEAVQRRITALETGSSWSKDEGADPDLEESWALSMLEEMMILMKMIFLRLEASTEIISSEPILAWLQLMQKYSFFADFEPVSEAQARLVSPLQALVSLVTLAFLKLSNSFAFLHDAMNTQREESSQIDASNFFLDRGKIGEIHEIFLAAANQINPVASPAVVAWGMIIYTIRELGLATRETRESQLTQKVADQSHFNDPQRSRRHSSSSIGSIQQSIFEDLFEIVRGASSGQDPVEFLIKSAVDGSHVFDVITTLASYSGNWSGMENYWMRNALLDLTRIIMGPIGYTPEIVSTILCILAGSDRTWERKDADNTIPREPRAQFLQNADLMSAFYDAAQARFPYEALPFLRLCRILAASGDLESSVPLVAQRLQLLDTFTQAMPAYFQQYDTVREDENANLISLTQPLEMLSNDRQRLLEVRNTQNALQSRNAYTLGTGAVGRVISESRPPVVMWEHQYSALSFLGAWLELAQSGPVSNFACPLEFSNEVIAEIVGLLVTLVSTASNTPNRSSGHLKRSQYAQSILEGASDGLSRDEDIVTVVIDIFERELQSIRFRPATDRSLDILIAGTRFVEALINVLPGRVWPLLARSSLLDVDGKGGILGAIISSVEVATGDFTFLCTCVQLYDAMIEDAIRNAVNRRASEVTSDRYTDPGLSNVFAPSHVMTKVLFALTQTMVEVYESSTNWRFSYPEQKLAIKTSLATSFRKIIQYSYGVDDNHDLNLKLTTVLSSSALYLMNVFRSPTSEDLGLSPLLWVILDGLQTPVSTLDAQASELWVDQVESTLKLSISLVQAGRFLADPFTSLEAQLFNIAPALVRLYTIHPRYKLLVLNLLESLVNDAASFGDGEPPSLLGRLGVESSKSFLEILSSLDSPYNDMKIFVAIWKLLSALVSKRQQWFAVFLLTGSAPQDSFKQRNGETRGGDSRTMSMRGKAFLTMALDLLSSIDRIQLRVAIAMLGFVQQAQENWPWATMDVHTHQHFLTAMFGYVGKLNTGKSSPLDQCYQTAIASTVADLLTVYLHYAKESHDGSLFKKLIPAITWYANNAVDVSGYNASLHSNLRKNFAMKFPKCKLSNFKRTALIPRDFGPDYFYDLELGSKMLGSDYAWSGSQNRGFVDELERANLNLSLVEAQLALLYSWKFLAVEHSSFFVQDREIQKAMAEVVRRCLEASTRPYPAESIFDKIQQTRMDFAMSLLQRLVDAKPKGSEFTTLLTITWDSIRSQGVTWETAFINNNLDYHRALLNVLFLSIQFHTAPSRRPLSSAQAHRYKSVDSPVLSVIVEIINFVVGQGFRTLTAYLLDENNLSGPKDFALVMAILQSCLRVRDVEQISAQLVSLLMDNETPRHATTLFSWAHHLTVDGDPIYGELSLLFLVELSSIPTMAEHLAAEAILTNLSSARLTQLLRSPTTASEASGPFDRTPRLYAIWAAGFLPLCLNLLHAVGRGLASEVAAFLNQFRGQLARASTALASKYTSAPSSSASTDGAITLTSVSEINSLALIDFVLASYRAAGPSAGVDPADIPPLEWDRKAVKEDVEELLERRAVLRGRIAAVDGREMEMGRRKPSVEGGGGGGGGVLAESPLEEKIVERLRGALVCLADDEA